MIKNSMEELIKTIKIKSSKNLLIENIISIIRIIIIIFLTIFARYDLRKEAVKRKTIEEHVNLSFSYNYTPIKGQRFKLIFRALQIKSELQKFIELIAKNQPQVVLEIGTARGGTLYLLAKISSPNAHLISLDLPGGKYGGGYNRWVGYFFKSFALDTQKISLIRADSHDVSTLKKLKKKIKGKPIDVLFIDGDHTYEGVKKDFEMYGPLVKKGGIIGFHDIVVHPPEINCNVNEFWNEIKQDFEYKEFVEDWEQKMCGIGIIFKKNS
ncbi:MAG: class I SAM-dependent methyltransferase [Promethearchaeota archaeon]